MNRTNSEKNRGKIKRRNRLRYIFMLFFALGLLLAPQAASFAQKKPQIKDVLLFEIEKYRSRGGGGMGRRFGSTKTLYVYKSGRIACQTLGYDPRGKEVRTNKSRCLQISKEKIGELTALAEQADFREAKESYRFFRGGIDYGNSFSITYFGKSASREILLTSPRRSENDSPLPASLTAFLIKIAEIDKDMEVKYELSK